MKRRTQKRLTRNLCGELFAECVAASHSHKGSQEQTDRILLKILDTQDSLLARLSHVEPGSVRKFFRKYRDDIDTLRQETERMIGGLG